MTAASLPPRTIITHVAPVFEKDVRNVKKLERIAFPNSLAIGITNGQAIFSESTERHKEMADYQKAVGAALAINTGIFVVEGIAGYQASSLSLIMDSVHNLSDEMALVCLYLAFIVARGPSQKLLRSANVFNSVGLILISGLLLWQAAERVLNPVPVPGWVAIVVGLAAAAANWGVARLLMEPGRRNAAIRLAYIHNLGDVWVSLAPVAAGLLLLITGKSFFDPLVAGAVALWIIVTTAREVFASQDELIWPERIVRSHSDHDDLGRPHSPK